MVGTVGAARRLGGRGALAGAGTAFAAGLIGGSALVFGGLGLIGMALRPGRTWVGAVAALSLAAVASDALGLRVRPQIPFQVPERWRQTLPLPLAVFLYGLLLGTGLTTYVPAAAAWALLALSPTLGTLASPLEIGLALAAGRALPVLALAPLEGRALGARALLLMAERPRALRIVRLLAAATLTFGVGTALAGRAVAATVVATTATDATVAGADLAWEHPGAGGFLRRGALTTPLEGRDPVIGGSLVAWHVGAAVTVAARDTLVPVLQETVPRVQKLAVSDRWLVLRQATPEGNLQLVAQSLTDPARTTTLAATRSPAQLGRPYLEGSRVVFHVATARASWISIVDLSTGTRRRGRSSADAQLLNPSLLGTKLLYVRVSRCAQQLRVGPLSGGPEQVLYSLPPLAGQDAGHERGLTRQGSLVPCADRVHPTTRALWTTALTSNIAYVTTLRRGSGGRATPTLLKILR